MNEENWKDREGEGWKQREEQWESIKKSRENTKKSEILQSEHEKSQWNKREVKMNDAKNGKNEESWKIKLWENEGKLTKCKIIIKKSRK